MLRIIVTKGVKEYRATIPLFVNTKDTVLEIGFAWGTTTNLLYKVCKKVIGIDKSTSYFTAVKNYPWIEFHQIDAFNISEVQKFGYKLDKIYIDISGSRSIYEVIKIVQMYKCVFKPELIVVKSSKLEKFVSECRVFSL